MKRILDRSKRRRPEFAQDLFLGREPAPKIIENLNDTVICDKAMNDVPPRIEIVIRSRQIRI